MKNNIDRRIDFDTLRGQSLAAAHLAAEARQPRFRAVEPKAGELYFLNESVDDGVEWLLVDDEPDPEGRLPVLAVDVYPQLGSRDVALYTGDPLRVANVRCDLEARLEPSRFGPEERSGDVPANDLAVVRERRAAIASASLEPSLGDRVADGDPEYWRWRRTVRGTISRLEGDVTFRESADDSAGVIPFEVSRRRATGFRWTASLALAASVLLLVGLASLWRAYQLGGDLEAARSRLAALSDEKSAVEHELAAEIADLEAELAERERLAAVQGGDQDRKIEALRAELADRRRVAAQLAAERDGQAVEIARLEKQMAKLQAKPLPEGTAIVVLGYDPSAAASRGVIRLGSRQEALALLLEVFTGELYDGYRIEVRRPSNDRTVLSTDELAWSGNTLGVVVSTAKLVDGEYDIHLFGVENGVEKELGERYEMTLVRW